MAKIYHTTNRKHVIAKAVAMHHATPGYRYSNDKLESVVDGGFPVGEMIRVKGFSYMRWDGGRTWTHLKIDEKGNETVIKTSDCPAEKEIELLDHALATMAFYAK